MSGPPMPVEADRPLSTDKRYTLSVSANDMMHILTAFVMSRMAGNSDEEKAVATDLVRQFQDQVRARREQEQTREEQDRAAD